MLRPRSVIRRNLCGGDLDRSGRDAGLCRLAGGRVERRRRLSYLRRRDDFGEGYNMQQVPKEEQGLFGRMTAIMGQSYVLHTPEGIRDALRQRALCVNHPYRAGPFYLLLPLNTQPAKLTVNLAALPTSRNCRSSHPPTTRRSNKRPRRSEKQARSRSRRAAGRAAMMRRCAGWLRQQRCGRSLAWFHRRAARCAPAEHACQQYQGFDLWQLRNG